MAATAQKSMPKIERIEKLEKVERLYTLAEYLRREERTVDKHEFYNGKIIKMANAKFYHNLIAQNVAFEIRKAAELFNKDYYVLGDGQKIFIEADNVAVYPDALVICEAPQFYKGQESLVLNPKVVIEVLSPRTATYDRAGKFDHYKQIPTFQEYVLIEQNKISVETRFQEETDLWRYKTVVKAEEMIYLRSLDLSISIADIYKKVVFKSK
jgi:Uma2 family endonuclease